MAPPVAPAGEDRCHCKPLHNTSFPSLLPLRVEWHLRASSLLGCTKRYRHRRLVVFLLFTWLLVSFQHVHCQAESPSRPSSQRHIRINNNNNTSLRTEALVRRWVWDPGIRDEPGTRSTRPTLNWAVKSETVATSVEFEPLASQRVAKARDRTVAGAVSLLHLAAVFMSTASNVIEYLTSSIEDPWYITRHSNPGTVASLHFLAVDSLIPASNSNPTSRSTLSRSKAVVAVINLPVKCDSKSALAVKPIESLLPFTLPTTTVSSTSLLHKNRSNCQVVKPSNDAFTQAQPKVSTSISQQRFKPPPPCCRTVELFTRSILTPTTYIFQAFGPLQFVYTGYSVDAAKASLPFHILNSTPTAKHLVKFTPASAA